jgi:F0F1-type ATP synthase assembly protein I
MDENPLDARMRRDWRIVGAATGIGCTIVVSLLLCIGVGILIDRWLGIEPIGVLVGVALGLAASGYSLYELTVVGDPERGLVKVQKRDQATTPSVDLESEPDE